MPAIGDTEQAILAAAVGFHNDMVRMFEECGQSIEPAEVEAMYKDMNRQRRNVGWAAMSGETEILAFGAWLSSRLLSTWRLLQTAAEGDQMPVRPTTINVSVPVQP